MDISQLKVAQIKALLMAAETDVPQLLEAMEHDKRVSVQKEAAAFMRRKVREEEERERLLQMYAYETQYYNENIYHDRTGCRSGHGRCGHPAAVLGMSRPERQQKGFAGQTGTPLR